MRIFHDFLHHVLIILSTIFDTSEFNFRQISKDIHALGLLYYDIILGIAESSDEETILDDAISQSKTQF